MSTDVTENVTEEATRKRIVLSLQDRIKVVDYLRSLPEPIVADSNNAIAAIVSEATKVAISYAQLKYMFEELTEMNLSAKVHVKSLLTTEGQLQEAYERSIAFEVRIAKLEAQISNIEQSIASLLRTVESLSETVGKLTDVLK